MVASFLASPVRAERGLHIDNLHRLYMSADPPPLRLLRHHQARPFSMAHQCCTDAGMPEHTVFSSRARMPCCALLDSLLCWQLPLDEACEELLQYHSRVSRVKATVSLASA